MNNKEFEEFEKKYERNCGFCGKKTKCYPLEERNIIIFACEPCRNKAMAYALEKVHKVLSDMNKNGSGQVGL